MSALCEDYLSISIYRLRAIGFLKGDRHAELLWNDGEAGKVNILIRINHERPFFRLDYKHRKYGGEWKDAQNQVQLEKTSCNFGGFRWWMRCPLCKKRCARIYFERGYVACRKCLGLFYKSQMIPKRSRIYKKLADIAFIEPPEVRTKFWKGEPTKRMRKFIRFIDREEG